MKCEPVLIRSAVMRFLLLIGCSLVATHIIRCGSESLFNVIETVRAATSKNNNEASSIAIQADGKILIAGSARAGTSNNFAVVRYNSNGTLDESFDGDGIVTTDVGTNTYDTANAIAIQADGKIVVAGRTVSADNNSSGIADNDFAVARYNVDGSLDASFNNNGKVVTAISKAGDLAHAVAIMPDGKIVVAGETNKFPNSVFAILRYSSNGTLDTSFDDDGITTTEVGVNSDSARAIAVQPDGKILAAGYAYIVSGIDFAVVRYNANGTLDASFDKDGKVTTDLVK